MKERMSWIWVLLGALVAGAGLRYRRRLRSERPSEHPPAVDDLALQRILDEGTLPAADDEPLDMDEVARAEEEFWSESWDEPEEYRP
jgi:hypothetical protein